MKQAATRELYAYWNLLRGERVSPDRSQIDPSAIRGILANTFMLAVDDERHYPFRLSGTRLNALLMDELKGRSFTDLWQDGDRKDIEDTLRFVCQEANAVIIGATAAPRFHDPIDLEILLLPIRHFGRTNARVLGCVTPARSAGWMGLIPVDRLVLRGLRNLPGPGVPDTQDLSARGELEPDIATDVPNPHGLAKKPDFVQRHNHLILHDFTR